VGGQTHGGPLIPASWPEFLETPDFADEVVAVPKGLKVRVQVRVWEKVSKTDVISKTIEDLGSTRFPAIAAWAAGFTIDRVVMDNGVSGASTRLVERPREPPAARGESTPLFTQVSPQSDPTHLDPTHL
jgi:hypothetical protein